MNDIKIEKTAACYIRVSTDDQLDYSPESQLAEIKKYASEHGYYIPEKYIFRDEGISGRSTAKRPGFNEMISVAKQKPKPFDAVLLWKFSRFARNRTDAVVYKSMLRRQLGIEVISVSENIGDDPGTSVILESMFEAMDEYYSINLSNEVKRSMKLKAERGESTCPAPYGYKNENKKYIIEPEEAEIVKYIYNAYAAGTGFRKIASELNARDIKNKRGNVWDNRAIEYILSNPVYAGYIRFSDGRSNNKTRYKDCDDSLIISEGVHEAIIEPELWKQTQEHIAEQKKRYGKYQRQESAFDWMLRGLLRCSACGSTLILTHAGGNGTQCHKYARGQCSISHNISLAKANQIIIEALEEAAETLNFDVEPVTASAEMNTATIKKSLEAEKKKLDKVKTAYEEGIDSLEEYRENKQRITQNITLLETEIKKATEKKIDKAAFGQKITAALPVLKSDTVSEKEKNETLRSFVSYIVFSRPENHFEIHFYE